MNICIFGDSITWGAFDCEKGGWVERMKTDLFKKGNEVYNLGISGDTTNEVSERMDCEVKARNPGMIIFAIGINDSPHGENEKLKIGEFEKNISTLLSKAEKITDKVAFVGLNYVNEKEANSRYGTFYSNKYIKECNETIRIFCRENNIAFIDILKIINCGDLYDGLHPDSKGHQKIFEEIKKKLSFLWE